jgi:hypothetical protein
MMYYLIGSDEGGYLFWKVGGFMNNRLKVSNNGKFLEYVDGTPFFWMGDTGWLLFSKLDLLEAEMYLEDRRQKGFNVVQVMVIHSIDEVNIYGESALINKDISLPNIKNDNSKSEYYGYWEHVDNIVDMAAKKGIYLAMVPVWGAVVKAGYTVKDRIKVYGQWLAKRYKDKPNIIWIIGGDIRGDVEMDQWKALAEAIRNIDSEHLMTFHPFGRTQSSTWFHKEDWLDFNMFQSGHRRYGQTMKQEAGEENIWIGQDNWRYVQSDYCKLPPKPTIDGEPSYEGIPQGLHNPSEPYWTAADCRRYAYWAVFAGAFGHTYGNNSVMQMHKPDSGKGAYGVKNYWYEAINDIGAVQMKHLKNLMLSVPFHKGIPDQSIIHGDEGEKYERLLVTRGEDYLFVYDYTGRKFNINMGKITGELVNAWWYDPENGGLLYIGSFKNEGVQEFTPSEKIEDSNDWVLIVTDGESDYFKL